MLLKKVEPPNSTFAISIQATIDFVFNQFLVVNQSTKNMQHTSVGITYTQKFNLGNYESLELGINLYAKVDADEEAESVTEFLLKQAEYIVKAQAAPVLKGVNYQAMVKRKESWVAASDEEGGF